MSVSSDSSSISTPISGDELRGGDAVGLFGQVIVEVGGMSLHRDSSRYVSTVLLINFSVRAWSIMYH
jgi:hypothetical protein